MSNSEFSPVTSSIVIRDLITRMRIRDVMSTDIESATPDSKLSDIKLKMKVSGISGVPVVEDRRLVGIISLDDIITALEDGRIDEPVKKSMSKDIIMLKESMPLSIAIGHFEKYTYRRFPVVNGDSELVGMLTSRDILTSLLFEINKEVDRLENMLPASSNPPGTHIFYKKYPVKKYDMETAGSVSSEIKKICKQQGLDTRVIRKIGVSLYELEINLVVHSEGGSLSCIFSEDSFKIISQDHGPGIEDTAQALEEGYSTANEWVKSLGFGAGMGLPNVKRLSNKFSIESTVGVGTKITTEINLKMEKKDEA